MSNRRITPVAALLLATLPLAAATVPSPYEIRKPDFKTYTFEENAIPADFTAGPGSRLTLSADYAKNGRNSLRWDWSQEGAWIEYRNPEAFRHLTGENPDPVVYEWVTFCYLSSFSSWIFSEKPLGGQLDFEIGGSRFYLNLNFSGWTANDLMYGRDLARFPKPGSDVMRIRAPRGVARGTLWLDDFSPRRELDVRAVRKSARMPYVADPKLSSEKPLWMEAPPNEVGFSVAIFDLNAPKVQIDAPEKLTDEQLQTVRRLGQEYLDRFKPGTGFHNSERQQLAQTRERWKLRRNGKFVDGNIHQIPTFYNDLHRIGRALRYGKLTDAEQAETRELLRDMADLLVQHGHTSYYGLRIYFIAPMQLLRDELKAMGKYDDVLNKIRFIAGVDEFYQKNSFGNADFYNTLLDSCIGSIFLQDDPRAQYRDLLALQRWLNHTAENSELMPDGTFTHHRMVYSGYGLPAIGPICRTVHLLRGTPFFPQKMYEQARKAILVMSFYANPFIPHMFSGRWRNCSEFNFNFVPNLAFIAESTSPIDPATAARYLAYEELYGKKTDVGKRFRAAGIKPDPMHGTQALNYAVSMTHRQGREMAVVRGQRDALFANEAYANQNGNTMGRYLNFGQMQILGENPEKSGFVLEKGWNYNFWPGTTARVLSADALRQHFENVEALTREYFAGAVDLDGAGMWAMKLQEELPEVGDALRVGPPVWFLGKQEYAKRCRDSQLDTDFRARKSVFAFDGMLLMLGSAISATDDAPVATTLFQNSLAALDKSKFRSGEGFLIDSVGNGYVYRDGNLQLKRGETAWPFHPNWDQKNPANHEKILPNKGEMELAYFDHGGAPKNAGYEYLALLPSRADRAESYAKLWRQSPNRLPFRIMRRDRDAHIVEVPGEALTGYAMFESGSPRHGLLREVNAPCIAMLRQKEGKLHLSLLNPRFDDTSRPGLPLQQNVKTRIKLDGDWRLLPGSPLVRSLGNGEFEITNRNLEATQAVFSK